MFWGDEIQTKSEKSFVQTLPAGGQEETGQERRDYGTIPAPVPVLCSDYYRKYLLSAMAVVGRGCSLW